MRNDDRVTCSWLMPNGGRAFRHSRIADGWQWLWLLSLGRQWRGDHGHVFRRRRNWRLGFLIRLSVRQTKREQPCSAAL